MSSSCFVLTFWEFYFLFALLFLWKTKQFHNNLLPSFHRLHTYYLSIKCIRNALVCCLCYLSMITNEAQSNLPASFLKYKRNVFFFCSTEIMDLLPFYVAHEWCGFINNREIILPWNWCEM